MALPAGHLHWRRSVSQPANPVMKLIRLFRNVTFLLIMSLTLLMRTVAFAIQTVRLSAEVAVMTGQAAATVIAHRKAIAKAVTRAKAKARLGRMAVAVPVAGAVLAAEFERRDYQQWQNENPDGSFSDYACEVGTVSAEVIDEVLQALPERVRPSRELVLSQLPGCSKS